MMLKPSGVLLLSLSVAALAALSACRSLPPSEATQSALDETRELVREHVADPERGTQMIAVVDLVEAEGIAYEAQRKRIDKALMAANADPATTREELEAIYALSNQAYREALKVLVRSHMELGALATAEEWPRISRTENRVGGS
jgi:hypothetical protein